MKVHSLYAMCSTSQRTLLFGRFTGFAGLFCSYEQHVDDVVCGAWCTGTGGLRGRGTSLITWPLRIVQLLGHCASSNYLATAHRPIIWLLRIDQRRTISTLGLSVGRDTDYFNARLIIVRDTDYFNARFDYRQGHRLFQCSI